MKFIYSLLGLSLIASCAHKKGPLFYSKDKMLNVGAVHLNSTFKGTVQVKNTGDQDLIIKNVYSDCECTIVNNYPKTLAPGALGVIHFNYSPHMKGFDQQNIFIENNSTNQKNFMAVIRAEVDY